MPDSDEFVPLLTGTSARRWHTLLTTLLVVAVAVAIPACIDVVAPFSRNHSGALFLPFIFVMALCFPIAGMVKQRSKDEIASGYSTVDFTDISVARVDSKTGRVLRRAGEPRSTGRFGYRNH